MRLLQKSTWWVLLVVVAVTSSACEPARTPVPAETPEPLISEITFATSVTEEGEPKDSAGSFPPDTTRVYAAFRYANISPSIEVSVRWRCDGWLFAEKWQDWEDFSSGKSWVRLHAGDRAFSTGHYELQISVDGDGMQRGHFFIREPSVPEPAGGDWSMVLGVVGNGIELANQSHYVYQSNGALWIVAEIRNLTDKTLGQPAAVLRIGDLEKKH